MSDYQAVTKALSGGADPAMLCATCPWDRNCLNPPTMTTADVDEQISKAAAADKAAMRADSSKVPMTALMTALVMGGRDTALQACPVLAVRLRSGDGRKIAEGIRSMMQGWEES